MKHLWCALLLVVFAGPVHSIARGQVIVTPSTFTSQIQTGFAIITPLQGGGQGLSVSESLVQQIEGSTFQANVQPSPPVTLTNVIVNLNSTAGINTGVAIVNPNPAL